MRSGPPRARGSTPSRRRKRARRTMLWPRAAPAPRIRCGRDARGSRVLGRDPRRWRPICCCRSAPPGTPPGGCAEPSTRPSRAPVPVICVGNLVAGGAGKTPVALALAALAREPRGHTAVHIVTRGYGGRLAGPVRVDPARHDRREVGDEALLLAAARAVLGRRATAPPALPRRSRPAPWRSCSMTGSRIRAIAKDLALIVVDGAYGFGNGRVMPAGPLRESLRRGLARADGVVLLAARASPLGCRRSPGPTGSRSYRRCWRRSPANGLPGSRVVAFAGIGRPEKFFATLRSLGAELVGARKFPDHHPFTAGEIAALRRAADRDRAQLVTTAKDWVRLPAAARAPASRCSRSRSLARSRGDRLGSSPRSRPSPGGDGRGSSR